MNYEYKEYIRRVREHEETMFARLLGNIKPIWKREKHTERPNAEQRRTEEIPIRNVEALWQRYWERLCKPIN